MSNNIPDPIRIYHIVHLDKLQFIIQKGELLCDKVISSQQVPWGTTIGMQSIKERRLRNPLGVYPNLTVGQCVPFYFCPRSVMLYLIYRRHPDLSYQGGQTPIVHLVADMRQTIEWAIRNNRKWAFTTSNAGARYFESYNDWGQLAQIDWDAVNARQWSESKEGKQAEFLIEYSFPWQLVQEIGVYSPVEQKQVNQLIDVCQVAGVNIYIPPVNVHREWYY